MNMAVAASNFCAIAVLKSAVRGLHHYKVVPPTGSEVELTFTEDRAVKARFPRAIQVKWNNKMVGQLAAENCRLIHRWLIYLPQYKVSPYIKDNEI